MSTSAAPGDARPGARPPRIRRGGARHQWEKDRARAPDAVRRRSGATEHDTGLAPEELAFAIGYREAPATEDLAAAFRVPAGAPLLERSYRARRAGDAAFLWLARSWLVRAHVSANPDLLDPAREPWPGGTYSQLATVGIEIGEVVERISGARPPTAAEARLLGRPRGLAAVIDLRKTSVDTTGRVVEVADVVLAGDRTELVYVTPLTRW